MLKRSESHLSDGNPSSSPSSSVGNCHPSPPTSSESGREFLKKMLIQMSPTSSHALPSTRSRVPASPPSPPQPISHHYKTSSFLKSALTINDVYSRFVTLHQGYVHLKGVLSNCCRSITSLAQRLENTGRLYASNESMLSTSCSEFFSQFENGRDSRKGADGHVQGVCSEMGAIVEIRYAMNNRLHSVLHLPNVQLLSSPQIPFLHSTRLLQTPSDVYGEVDVSGVSSELLSELSTLFSESQRAAVGETTILFTSTMNSEGIEVAGNQGTLSQHTEEADSIQRMCVSLNEKGENLYAEILSLNAKKSQVTHTYNHAAVEIQSILSSTKELESRLHVLELLDEKNIGRGVREGRVGECSHYVSEESALDELNVREEGTLEESEQKKLEHGELRSHGNEGDSDLNFKQDYRSSTLSPLRSEYESLQDVKLHNVLSEADRKSTHTNGSTASYTERSLLSDADATALSDSSRRKRYILRQLLLSEDEKSALRLQLSREHTLYSKLWGELSDESLSMSEIQKECIHLHVPEHDQERGATQLFEGIDQGKSEVVTELSFDMAENFPQGHRRMKGKDILRISSNTSISDAPNSDETTSELVGTPQDNVVEKTLSANNRHDSEQRPQLQENGVMLSSQGTRLISTLSVERENSKRVTEQKGALQSKGKSAQQQVSPVVFEALAKAQEHSEMARTLLLDKSVQMSEVMKKLKAAREALLRKQARADRFSEREQVQN